MAQLPNLAQLSMIGMNAASGSGDGDGGGWRPKRKSTALQEYERKQRQKQEAASSEEWKEFRETFANDINRLKSMESKVAMGIDTDPVGYFNAQMEVFHRMVRWFVDDSHETFLMTTLQRNDKLLLNFRAIVSPFEKLCARLGYQYGKSREMVHTHLMLGILQSPSSRGGHHQERTKAKLRELKTYIILEDKKNAAPAAAAPAPAAAAPAPAAATGPSAPVSGVTPEFQHKLDEFDGQLEQIDKHIAHIKSSNPNPELPELVKATNFREMIQKERGLLIAKQNLARAKEALKNPPTLTLQLIRDEQKAQNDILDLELEIGDLKYELGV